jgi:phage terminase large subunit GpA-like protein
MTRALAVQPEFTREQREWLARQIEGLTTDRDGLTPSQWAEKFRYLPQSVTPMPGYYRFDVAPYLREIVDCLGVDSPVREVSVMKGVQLGLTVGVLENAIGYFIQHVKSAPMMLVTADADMAQLRMESYVTPMLVHSDLERFITSSDVNNPRKTGKTDKRIEWAGGGFLMPFGAQNANKLRSVSIQVLLRDEIDGWPDTVGKDGDPIKLSADRTAAYEGTRKIADISTPLVRGLSKIEARFRRGDQRYYFVCCLKCGHAQTLRFRRTNPDTGEVTGMVWETEHGRLVPDSVRYLCEACAHPHTNDDKTRLLSPEHGAEWRPTAVPATPDHRSYHISALYSPVGMQSWSTCVQKWLEAWDEEHARPRDLGSLQVFYNNVLGESYELRGEQVRFDAVSAHRRHEYVFGQVPNAWAARACGSPVLFVTCAVDVQKDNLAVAVFGWCRGRRALLIDYWRFEGDTSQLSDAGTWGRLRKLIEEHEYRADDGKRYRVQLTLIDCGYNTDQVYQFCGDYEAGVAPVKGRDAPLKSATLKEFGEYTTPNGLRAYAITVDFYKDRWSAALRRGWDGTDMQPQGHFNAPLDATDKQLKELTVEVKREKIEKATGKRLGFEWHRPHGADNELWDLIIYASCGCDLIAWSICRDVLELEFVNWTAFYDYCEQQTPYFTTD